MHPVKCIGGCTGLPGESVLRRQRVYRPLGAPLTLVGDDLCEVDGVDAPLPVVGVVAPDGGGHRPAAGLRQQSRQDDR